MERKFKPVAMRFTQEEFDGMDKSGMDINHLTSFYNHPYLVNNYMGTNLNISNTLHNTGINGRTVIETCNPKLFRQYCGLENSIEDELKEAISKNKRGFCFLFLDPVEENKEKIINQQSISELQDRLHRIKNEAIIGQTNEKEVIVSRKGIYTDVPSDMPSRKNQNDKFSFFAYDCAYALNDVYLKGCFSKHENEQTFQSKDLQYFCEESKKWRDFWLYDPNLKIRFKPKQTTEESLSTEIEALNQKAKEMGFKAVITFESL